MTGWASFFAGFSAPIAAAALAFSEYLGHFFPALSQENAPVIAGSGEWAIRLGGAQAVACGLVAVFTVLNILGVQRVARVQNVLTGAKVLVLLAFIVLGFTIGRRKHVALRHDRHARRGDAACRAVRDQPGVGVRGL